MGSRRILILFICGIICTLTGCHTYFFQPVEKLIVGTWIKSPQTDNEKIEWTFSEDNTLRIAKYTGNGSIKEYIDYCGTTPDIPWKVENKITRHILYTDEYKPFCSASLNDKNPKWIIIEISKTELFISSIYDKSHGAYQWGFVRK